MTINELLANAEKMLNSNGSFNIKVEIVGNVSNLAVLKWEKEPMTLDELITALRTPSIDGMMTGHEKVVTLFNYDFPKSPHDLDLRNVMGIGANEANFKELFLLVNDNRNSSFDILGHIDFEVGDIIRNRKTGKFGVIKKCYRDEGIIKYHLDNTPNNIHTCCNPAERFDVIKRFDDGNDCN